ncbi:hypothetical protein H9P43_006832, partial [Blastocladiella emersonii ATCC 22665]
AATPNAAPQLEEGEIARPVVRDTGIDLIDASECIHPTPRSCRDLLSHDPLDTELTPAQLRKILSHVKWQKLFTPPELQEPIRDCLAALGKEVQPDRRLREKSRLLTAVINLVYEGIEGAVTVRRQAVASGGKQPSMEPCYRPLRDAARLLAHMMHLEHVAERKRIIKALGVSDFVDLTTIKVARKSMSEVPQLMGSGFVEQVRDRLAHVKRPDERKTNKGGKRNATAAGLDAPAAKRGKGKAVPNTSSSSCAGSSSKQAKPASKSASKAKRKGKNNKSSRAS